MLKQFCTDVIIVLATMFAIFFTITAVLQREAIQDSICATPADCAPDPKQVMVIE